LIMKTLKVRKGIESDPLIWGLKVNHFFPVLALFVVLIFGGLGVIIMSIGTNGAGVKFGLLMWILGLPAAIAFKIYLGRFAKDTKTKFGKKVTTVTNHDF